MGDANYASNLLMAALSYIDDVLDNCMFNANGEEYESPFSDTGNSFKCDTFEVRAYDWDWDAREDSTPQPFNFKWRDIEVTWPKYVSRGPKTNRKVSPDEISEMLDECVEAICKYSAKRYADEKSFTMRTR